MAITKISPDVVDFDAGITISTADNTSQLILTSTDADSSEGPVLELYRNSSSPADSDVGGQIEFHAENDADEKIAYATIRIKTADVSDGTEDGTLAIQTITAGSNRNRFNIQAAETVINEDSRDLDFRVESDNSANALFVQGSDGKVGINIAAPARRLLEIQDASPGIVLHDSDVTNLTHEIVGGGNAGLEISADYQNVGTGYIRFDVGGSERARILEGGGITFNGDTAAANALDDYEEGNYTPTYLGASASGTQAYSHQNGFYIKIGNLVTAYFDINVSSSSGMSGAPYLSLPVQAKNHAWYAPFIPWEVASNFTDSDQKAAGYVSPNSTVIVMHKYTAGNSVIESGYLNINTTGRISGQVTYQAA